MYKHLLMSSNIRKLKRLEKKLIKWKEMREKLEKEMKEKLEKEIREMREKSEKELTDKNEELKNLKNNQVTINFGKIIIKNW